MPGLYFEELEEGKVYDHPYSRTITEMDNVLFTSMTMNPQPLHLDAEFAKTTQHGQRLVNSLFTMALVGGMSVHDLTFGTTLGNLGYERVEFPNPVFHGDTIRASSIILRKRESTTRPDRGIVWFEHRGINQRGEIVHVCERKGMMMKRPVDSLAAQGS